MRLRRPDCLATIERLRILWSRPREEDKSVVLRMSHYELDSSCDINDDSACLSRAECLQDNDLADREDERQGGGERQN